MSSSSNGGLWPAMMLVAVGNLTIDEFSSNSDPIVTAPGGASFYVASTANLLGASTQIVSSIGSDYPDTFLNWMRTRRIGLRTFSRAGSRTTRFVFRKSEGSRNLRISSPGDSIPSDCVKGWNDVIHLGPVFREINSRNVEKARNHTGFLSLDVQGLLRFATRSKKVLLRKSNIDGVLRRCDLVKAAEHEARILTSSRDPIAMTTRLVSKNHRFAIVSLGANGHVLASPSGCWRVPAYPEKRSVDTTGAGDAMIGAWLVTYRATNDPLWASCVGGAVASMTTRHVGLRKFRVSRIELFKRAAWTYSRSGRVWS